MTTPTTARLALVAAVVSLSTGCAPADDQARRIALANAETLVSETTESIHTDLSRADGDRLSDLVANGEVRFDRSFLGMTADEIAEQRIGGDSRGESILLGVEDRTNSTGSLLIVTIGRGETGNFDYSQYTVYGCWELRIDLSAVSVGDTHAVPCPAGISTFVGPYEEVEL